MLNNRPSLAMAVLPDSKSNPAEAASEIKPNNTSSQFKLAWFALGLFLLACAGASGFGAYLAGNEESERKSTLSDDEKANEHAQDRAEPLTASGWQWVTIIAAIAAACLLACGAKAIHRSCKRENSLEEKKQTPSGVSIEVIEDDRKDPDERQLVLPAKLETQLRNNLFAPPARSSKESALEMKHQKLKRSFSFG